VCTLGLLCIICEVPYTQAIALLHVHLTYCIYTLHIDIQFKQIEHPGGIGLNGLNSSSSSGGDTKGISKAKSNRRHKATSNDTALSSGGSSSGKGPRYNSSNVPQDALMVSVCSSHIHTHTAVVLITVCITLHACTLFPSGVTCNHLLRCRADTNHFARVWQTTCMLQCCTEA
jgi:hypothetical protein